MMSRHRPDPFALPATCRYLILWDLQWHAIESVQLKPGTDLSAALAAAVERLRVGGWRPTGTAEFGFVFLDRGAERRLLTLSARDPAVTSQQSFSPYRS